MFKKYLLSSVAAFDAPKDQGATPPTPAEVKQQERDNTTPPTPAEVKQQERDNIKVESTNENAEGEGDGDDKGEGEGEKEDVKEENESETEEYDNKEELEKEIKDDDPEKLKKTIQRLQRRIDKESGSKKELARQLKETKDALAAKDVDGDKLSKEDAQRMAKDIAAQEITQREFDAACNRLADAAEKVEKDFDKKVKELNEDLGPIPGDMISVLDELDNGGAVLAHLVNDADKAEEIFKLPPARRAIKLAKLSEEIKPKAKAVSKVPPPNPEVGTARGASRPNLHDPNVAKKMTDSDWIEQRNREVLEKRKDGTRPNLR